MENPLWKQMPSEAKATALKNIYEYANAKAKATVSDYDVDKKYSNIYNKEEKYKISPAEYYVAMAYAGQKSNDTDNNGKVTQKEKQRALAKSKAYSGSKSKQIVKSEKKQNKSK